MAADRIIRDAARAVLDADQPVRVFDGDEMVGLVDDEAILRVVVAEDDVIEEPAGANHATLTDAHVPTQQGAAQ